MKIRIAILLLAVCFCLATQPSAFSAGGAMSLPRTGIVSRDAGPIDINTAGMETLQGLKGIGPVLAGMIIDYRDKNGPFKSVDDLLNVSGIGPVKLETLRNLVKVEPVK